MGMIINPYRFANPNTPPACISDGNTVAWYIADDLTTITKDGSNLVAQWNDKLGSGHNLLQSTDTNKPTWSADGITFNGSDNYMSTDSFTYDQPSFYYVVLKQITWTSGRNFWDGAYESFCAIKQNDTTPKLRVSGGGESWSNEDGNLSLDTFGIIRVLYYGASSKFIVNNNTQINGNWGTRGPHKFTLGCNKGKNYFSNIQVKEIILRKISDSAGDETAIYNYLATKYSIT